MGRAVMGGTSESDQPHPRQSKHPPGRRKMVGFDVQRLLLHDQSTVKGVDKNGRGLLKPSAMPTFINTRQLHNGVSPTMFSDLVDIIHKKQGVLVLNKGSPTPATDRTFTFTMPTTTSKFPFDRKIHQGSVHFT